MYLDSELIVNISKILMQLFCSYVIFKSMYMSMDKLDNDVKISVRSLMSSIAFLIFYYIGK